MAGKKNPSMSDLLAEIEALKASTNSGPVKTLKAPVDPGLAIIDGPDPRGRYLGVQLYNGSLKITCRTFYVDKLGEVRGGRDGWTMDLAEFARLVQELTPELLKDKAAEAFNLAASVAVGVKG